MKGFFFAIFVFGISMMFSCPAWALEAPAWGTDCATFEEEDGTICLDWEDVEGAKKYSVDIVVQNVEMADGEIMDIEFSFGTSDRTDGGLMGDSDLCIPVTAFEYEVEEGVFMYLGGYEAYAKVKALNPGKGQGRQNHPFSESICTFTIPEMEAP